MANKSIANNAGLAILRALAGGSSYEDSSDMTQYTGEASSSFGRNVLSLRDSSLHRDRTSPIRLDELGNKTYPLTSKQRKEEDFFRGGFCPEYYQANPREPFVEKSVDYDTDYSSSYNPFADSNLCSSPEASPCMPFERTNPFLGDSRFQRDRSPIQFNDSGNKTYPSVTPSQFDESGNRTHPLTSRKRKLEDVNMGKFCPQYYEANPREQFVEKSVDYSTDYSSSYNPFAAGNLGSSPEGSRSQVVINVSPRAQTTVNLGGESYFSSPGNMTPPSFNLPSHKFSTPVKQIPYTSSCSSRSSAYDTAHTSFTPDLSSTMYQSAASTPRGFAPDLSLQQSFPITGPSNRTPPPMGGGKSFSESVSARNVLTAGPGSQMLSKLLDDMSHNESISMQQGIRNYQNSRRQNLSRI